MGIRRGKMKVSFYHSTLDTNTGKRTEKCLLSLIDLPSLPSKGDLIWIKTHVMGEGGVKGGQYKVIRVDWSFFSIRKKDCSGRYSSETYYSDTHSEAQIHVELVAENPIKLPSIKKTKGKQPK